MITSVRFEDKIYVRNLNLILEGKEMEEEQEKTIIKNLKSRLSVLLSCKKNRVSQIATIGHDLKILIDEIEEIENALHVFKGNDDEDC